MAQDAKAPAADGAERKDKKEEKKNSQSCTATARAQTLPAPDSGEPIYSYGQRLFHTKEQHDDKDYPFACNNLFLRICGLLGDYALH